eukprot:6167597-Pyramimonas_sp.AAC.1
MHAEFKDVSDRHPTLPTTEKKEPCLVSAAAVVCCLSFNSGRAAGHTTHVRKAVARQFTPLGLLDIQRRGNIA